MPQGDEEGCHALPGIAAAISRHALRSSPDVMGPKRGNHIETPLDRAPLMRRPTVPTAKTTRICWQRSIEIPGEGLARLDDKRVYRLMKPHGLLLERHTGRRRGRTHGGKVVVLASNLRWCSDGFEFTCWNGEIVRVGFAIDAHDREVIAWSAATNAGISGSDVRDMMPLAVERRFGAIRAPRPVEWLSDNGSPDTAAETHRFAAQLNLTPCITPVASPESNGLCEAFVKTFKRRLPAGKPIARRRRSACPSSGIRPRR